MSEEAADQQPGPSQTTYETLLDLPAMLASDSAVAASGDSSAAAATTAATQKTDRKPLKTFEDINVLFEQNRLHEAKIAIRENAWPLDSDVRRHLWPMLCARHRLQADAHLIDNNNAYLELVVQIFSTTNLPERPIMLPVFVDANHCFSYFLTVEGKAINDRVISILAYCQPDITFSPYLYSISAVLLHFLDELDSYNCLASLIASKDKKLITQTKLLYEVTWKTVMQVSKKYAKSSVQHLTKYDPHIKLERIFADWIWWIFNGLPFEHLVRVIDCFLSEGVKVLYRVAMAILILFERVTSNPANDWSQKIANSGVEATLYAFVREIPFTASKLLKVAFKIRGLSSAYIGRVFLKTEMVLKSSAQFSTATGGNSCAGTLDKAAAIKQLIRSKSSDDVLCRQQTDMNIESSIINNKFTYCSPHPRDVASGSYSMHNVKSVIVNPRSLSVVWGWLPIRLTICKPILLYTTEEHGCSIRTFFKRIEEHEHTLMLIKTVNGQIFGAYCSMSWQQRNLKDDKGKKQRYFGTGESFLFSLEPNPVKYPWIGITKEVTQHSCELFMAATNETIYVGGGEGNGILINGDLRFGKTDHCQTFDNPPLCEDKDFEIKVMEVFGFSAG